MSSGSMIIAKVMALLGLAVSARSTDPPREVARALRRVDVSTRWNHRRNARIQSATLDRIEFHEADPRPRQLLTDADHLRQALHRLTDRDDG